MSGITVWLAEAADSEAILRLVGYLAASIGERSPLDAAYAASYLQQPNSGVLLAEIDGRPVGLLSYSVRPNLYHAANSAMIEELVVEPDYRGQGVASRLMEALLKLLSPLDCAELSVSTGVDNTAAIRFYQDHGLVDESVLLERHFTLPS